MSKKRNTKADKVGKPNLFDFILLLGGLALSVVLMVFIHLMNLLSGTLFWLVCCVLAFVLMILLLMMFINKTTRWSARLVSFLLIIGLVIGVCVEAKAYETLKKISDTPEGAVTVSVYSLNDQGYTGLDDLEGITLGYQTNLGAGNIHKAIESLEETIWFGYKREYDSYLDLVEALVKGEVDCVLVETSYIKDIDVYNQIEGNENFPVFSECAVCVTSYSFEDVVEEEESDDEEESETRYESDLTKEAFVVYLSGVDSRSGDLTGRSNADVNILAVVNPTTRNVLLLTTPRDYYVDFIVAGKETFKDKLVHCGSYGTYATMKTLANLYDIDSIDLYAKINFYGIIDLVDAIGGITIENDETFYGAVSLQDSTGAIVATYSRTFEEGTIELDGKDAMVYCRDRHHVSGGDNGRGRHQMIVIKGIVNKILSDKTVLLNYSSILDAVGDNFVTNLSVLDMGSLVQMEINDRSSWNIYSFSVTGANGTGVCPTYSSSRELYVMIPYEETVAKAKNYVAAILNGDKITDLTPTVVG